MNEAPDWAIGMTAEELEAFTAWLLAEWLRVFSVCPHSGAPVVRASAPPFEDSGDASGR
jgi:hypothetical protein